MSKPFPPVGSRAWGYFRYSTLHQREASIEDQRRICMEYSARHGWVWEGSNHDAARSGTTFENRSGFFDMMAAAARGEFDVLVVEGLDRLSRQASGTHGLVEELHAMDITICTVQGGVVSDMEVAFKAVQNAQYVKDLAQKSRRGVEGTILAGRQSGRVPYGYKKIVTEKQATGLRVVDEGQAKIVRRIFRDYAAGVSIVAICRSLTGDNIEGPGGRPWRVGVLRGDKHKRTGILRNQLYRGRTVWGRTKTKRNQRSGTKKQKPVNADEYVTVETPDLAIVDDELFEAVQLRLEAVQLDEGESKKFQGKRKPEYLFTGLYRCGVCGSRYQILQDRMGCTGRAERNCDNRRRVQREVVEDLVLKALGPALLVPQFVGPFIAEYRREVDRAVEEWRSGRSAMEERLAHLTKASENARRDLGGDDLEGPARRTVLQDLTMYERERDQVARRLKTQPAHPVSQLTEEAIIQRMRDLIGKLQSALEGDGRDVHRATEVLRELVEKIVIEPISQVHEDGRGIGPVRITVTGNLTKLLTWSEDDRVIQHTSGTQSVLGHVTVLVDFTIDHHPVDVRLVPEGYETLCVMSAMLDDAHVPLTKADFVDGLAARLDEEPNYGLTSRQMKRIDSALAYLRDRDLVRYVMCGRLARYAWADDPRPDSDLLALAASHVRPINLPMQVIEVDEPLLMTVRVYEADGRPKAEVD